MPHALSGFGNEHDRVVSVPRPVLKELQDHARQIEEIVATLEELADDEGTRRIRSSLKEYEKGEYVVVEDPKEMKSLLGDCSGALLSLIHI